MDDADAATVLSRARQHRWLWALALVAVAFKLVASTVCLADAQPLPPAQVVMDAATEPGNGACLLGEGSACHCACPETLPVPASLVSVPGVLAAPFVQRAPGYAFAPAHPAPPLRPPIA